MVIAPDVTGMAEAGYTPRTINTTVNAAPTLLDPSLGSVLKHIFVPSNWDSGWRFLMYRDGIVAPAMNNVTFGYSAPVTAKMTGERPTYGLFDRAGAGSNSGQFNQPRGVAASPDGTRIYVLDTQNGRIQVFDETGTLVTIWGDGDDGVDLEVTDNGLGPYGLAVGQDGLVYVADTWNHRIVVIDGDGQVVRTFGEFGDNADSPDASLEPGKFYGPRGIVVFNNEIYVTDTGNERVQVFGLDGAFKRAWGGTGTAPGQLLEPVGITIGSDGNVYVADSGNGRISSFDINGAPLAQWVIPSWQGSSFYEPYLLGDENGHIFASDPNTASIQVFDLTGKLVATISNVDATRLQSPAGMTIIDATELLVADRGASEVYRIDLTEYPGLTRPAVIELP
ncbi:MAG TPA: NHL repeat-containing protein, partial [Thermomicrobiales bacterium]|nr:NHL repeat-containing protein [Thermomicrobiales bacterium]